MKSNNPIDKKSILPFEVPKGYFEEFPSKLQKAINNEENEISLWYKIGLILRGRFTIVTSIMVALVLVILQFSDLTKPEISINAEEAYTYLSNFEIDESDELMLFEYMDDLSTATVEPTEEEIIEYLMIQENIENQIY